MKITLKHKSGDIQELEGADALTEIEQAMWSHWDDLVGVKIDLTESHYGGWTRSTVMRGDVSKP